MPSDLGGEYIRGAAVAPLTGAGVGGDGAGAADGAGDAVGTGGSESLSPYAYEWTLAHNVKRCMHGLSEANYLRWNEAAVGGADGAQAWADRGVFSHSSAYSLPAPAGPAGENLAMYSAGYGVDVSDPVGSWYEEVRDCEWSTGCKTSTGARRDTLRR